MLEQDLLVNQSETDTINLVSFVIVTAIFLFVSLYALRFSLRHYRRQDDFFCRAWIRLGRPHCIGAMITSSSLFRSAWSITRVTQTYRTVMFDDEMEHHGRKPKPSPLYSTTTTGKPMERLLRFDITTASAASSAKMVNADGPILRCLNRISMLLQFTAISIVVERWCASENQTSRSGSILCGIMNTLLWVTTLVVPFIETSTG